MGVVGQALVAEARLLAQPVSFEVASTSHAEGIEDRMTMAPLAARRLAELVELGERVVVIELVVAAQAVELRDAGRSARDGTPPSSASIPFSGRGDPVPADLEPLCDAVRAGEFAALT